MGRLIPLVFLFALLLTGCGPHTAALPADGRSAGVSPDLPLSIGSAEIPFSDIRLAPLDSRLRSTDKRAYANGELILRRSPRNSAAAIYRVPRGAVLSVSPTGDPQWLRVGLTKKREAFVRKDETSGSLALALAQGKIDDKARLNPKPKHGNEPDVGNGKGGEPGTRDPAVQDAVEKIEDNLKTVEDAEDRFRADVTSFGPAADAWPAAKSASLTSSESLQSALADLNDALQSLAKLSGSLSANDRSAFQGLSSAFEESQDAIQQVRQSLNQMVDGSDWTQPIAALEDQARLFGSSIDAMRSAINRL